MNFNWKWILAGVVLAAAMAVASILLMIRLLPRELMRGAGVDPLYVMSVERVKTSGVVAVEVGSPVETGTVTRVNVSANLVEAREAPSKGEGVSTFEYPVSGPKAKGTVRVYATETKGVWAIQKIVVQLPESEITVEDKAVPEA